MNFDKMQNMKKCTVWHKNIAPKFQMKKVCFLVNFLENMHTSTYGIYNFTCKVRKKSQMATLTYSHSGNPGRTYKVKKMPRMATLNYSHSANPGRSAHRAHFPFFPSLQWAAAAALI